MSDRNPIWPRKPITLGTFLLVAAVAMALFVPSLSAHIAVMNTVTIDATPTDYAVTDDGETLVVELQVHNPTRADFTAAYGNLYGKVGDQQVTSLVVDVDETTIPSGETRTVTARVGIEEEHRETAIDAVESGQLAVTGQLKGTIENERVQIEVTTEGDDG
jgi:hypothetical protein